MKFSCTVCSAKTAILQGRLVHCATVCFRIISPEARGLPSDGLCTYCLCGSPSDPQANYWLTAGIGRRAVPSLHLPVNRCSICNPHGSRLVHFSYVLHLCLHRTYLISPLPPSPPPPSVLNCDGFLPSLYQRIIFDISFVFSIIKTESPSKLDSLFFWPYGE